MSIRDQVDRVRRRTVLERDLRSLRRAHGDAIGWPGPKDGPVVLIVSLSEFPQQLKFEGLLAKPLQLKGMTPVALVNSDSWIPHRYLGAFGIEQFVGLRTYVTDEARAEAQRETDAILARNPSIADLRDLTFHGAAIGRQVLSTISRALKEGTLDTADPEVRELLGELLPSTLESTLAAEALVDDLRPELLIFLERGYAGEAPLSDIALARGINVIQFVSGFQDDALVFKRYTPETRRLHPRSLSDASWEEVKHLPWTELDDRRLDEEFERRYDDTWALSRRIQGWTHAASREEIVGRLGLDPAKRTAVVFSHVLWDANMFFGEDLFGDQEEWFVETIRAAVANPRVNWIVKLHPANVWKLKREGFAGELGELEVIRRAVGELPPHVALLPADSDIGTRSIFDATDVGVTIRGSIGFELPCFGIPVITAGTGFYSGRGFTLDSATPEEYLARLARIETIEPLFPEELELARRHAYALFFLRSVRFSSFTATIRPLEQMGHPLDHDLVLNLKTREDVERAEDLRRFAEWAVDSRELDYLELPAREPAAAA
ncbi:MAG: hypothetical protein QOE36_3701 [Gaiellaceae bacterium]|nr:hypothetical protein [Gaiellaceae bacterium]